MVEVVAWRTLGLDLTKCQTNGCEVGSPRSNQLGILRRDGKQFVDKRRRKKREKERKKRKKGKKENKKKKKERRKGGGSFFLHCFRFGWIKNGSYTLQEVKDLSSLVISLFGAMEMAFG